MFVNRSEAEEILQLKLHRRNRGLEEDEVLIASGYGATCYLEASDRERKRSEILVQLLKTIMNHHGNIHGIKESLQAYEREDIPEENKRMGCNHKGPICEA